MKLSLTYQSTGVLFNILQPFSPLMHRAYFRKIYLSKEYAVPHDQPVLLATNHPSAFIDPLLLVTFLDPPVYNMTRGDIFRKAFFRKIMENLNMFPVYRVRDGYNDSDRNDGVIEYCIEKMRQKRVLNIFVEGEHHSDLRIRPIQKGIARIAFAAFEKHPDENLQIVPMGINFTEDGQPRTSVMMNYGRPLYVRDYWPMYQANPNRAVLSLCRDIEAALKRICFHINSSEDEVLVAQLLEMHRNDHPAPVLPIVVYGNTNRFLEEKRIVDAVNAMDATVKTDLKQGVERYFNNLNEAGIRDAALVNAAPNGFLHLLFFLAGLPFFIIGRLGTWPVLGVAKYIADTKVTKREYYGSVRMAVAFLVGMLYFPLLLLAALLSGKPWMIGLALLLPALGWVAMVYREHVIQWMERRRARKLPNRDRLIAERRALRLPWMP